MPVPLRALLETVRGLEYVRELVRGVRRLTSLRRESPDVDVYRDSGVRCVVLV